MGSPLRGIFASIQYSHHIILYWIHLRWPGVARDYNPWGWDRYLGPVKPSSWDAWVANTLISSYREGVISWGTPTGYWRYYQQSMTSCSTSTSSSDLRAPITLEAWLEEFLDQLYPQEKGVWRQAVIFEPFPLLISPQSCASNSLRQNVQACRGPGDRYRALWRRKICLPCDDQVGRGSGDGSR